MELEGGLLATKYKVTIGNVLTEKTRFSSPRIPEHQVLKLKFHKSWSFAPQRDHGTATGFLKSIELAQQKIEKLSHHKIRQSFTSPHGGSLVFLYTFFSPVNPRVALAGSKPSLPGGVLIRWQAIIHFLD